MRIIWSALQNSGTVAVKFVDHYGVATERYPLNPNGSPAGITGLTTADGRVTIMMPHPERVMRTVANSWHPDDWARTAHGYVCSVTRVCLLANCHSLNKRNKEPLKSGSFLSDMSDL